MMALLITVVQVFALLACLTQISGMPRGQKHKGLYDDFLPMEKHVKNRANLPTTTVGKAAAPGESQPVSTDTTFGGHRGGLGDNAPAHPSKHDGRLENLSDMYSMGDKTLIKNSVKDMLGNSGEHSAEVTLDSVESQPTSHKHRNARKRVKRKHHDHHHSNNHHATTFPSYNLEEHKVKFDNGGVNLDLKNSESNSDRELKKDDYFIKYDTLESKEIKSEILNPQSFDFDKFDKNNPDLEKNVAEIGDTYLKSDVNAGIPEKRVSDSKISNKASLESPEASEEKQPLIPVGADMISNKNDLDSVGDVHEEMPSNAYDSYLPIEEGGDQVAKDVTSDPKTDLEPRTSPNPPTPKKEETKSPVTEPVNQEKRDRYIASRPLTDCKVDSDCSPGRECKFSICVCGHEDMCAGHKKPVCGSDGTLYPSHCELHRTACMKTVHIYIDFDSKCKASGTDKPVSTALSDTRQANSHYSDDSKPKVHTKGGSASTTALIPDPLDVIEEGDPNVDPAVKSTTQAEEDGQSGVTSRTEFSRTRLGNRQRAQDSEDDQPSEQKEFKGKIAVAYRKEKDDVKSSDEEEEDEETKEDVQNGDDYVSSEDGDWDSDENEDVEGDDEDDDDYEVETVSIVATAPTVPLYCTPELYQRYKGNVLQYHCVEFGQHNCDNLSRDDRQNLAAVIFNYFDRDFDGLVEKEELWEMQLRENMDDLSTLCTLLDLVNFDDSIKKDDRMSAEEFINAFDIPASAIDRQMEVIPTLATAGNGLEIRCEVPTAKDVVWERNGVNLENLEFPGISVLSDGTLYIESVGVHDVGNLTCHERTKPAVKHIHMLTVQTVPKVSVSLSALSATNHKDITLFCHAEGVPTPTVQWFFNDIPVHSSPKYRIDAFDNRLMVSNADYTSDTGIYKCTATNQAGQAEDTETVYVMEPGSHYSRSGHRQQETFVVFHDGGYSMYDPKRCATQRECKGTFGNFHFIPDELDGPPSMCVEGTDCVWGDVVNVKDKFVYVTQPTQNRVLVIDVAGSYNPNQVIPVDKMPVRIQYLEHLDEVWVLCWNRKEDSGAKTIVIIREASVNMQHYPVHTQPIGNRFDLIQDMFLPPVNDLRHEFRYGYTVHKEQQGLFKVDLQEKKYTKAIDFSLFACVPKAVAFVPVGGKVLVHCHQWSARGEADLILELDYITDKVISNRTMEGTPYVSPDSRTAVIVDDKTGRVTVYNVLDTGEIKQAFEVTTGSAVSDVAFHGASIHHGYDLFLTSKDRDVIFTVSLVNGKVEVIKEMRELLDISVHPWQKTVHPISSGNFYSHFLSTLSKSSLIVVSGKDHNVQCYLGEFENPRVLVYAEPIF